MASFDRPNLVIFDEAEVNYNDARFLGIIVLMKSQYPYAYNEIDHTKIHAAVQRQTGVELPLDHIYRYLCDYVVVTGSHQITNKILSKSALEIEEHHLAILPLTPGYGSTEVAIDLTMPIFEIQSTAPQITKNYQALKIVVTGVPPVF